MIPPLAAAFATVAPELPGSLVSEQARDTLHSLADRVPPIWKDFGFECRLTRAEVVDLGVSVPTRNGTRVTSKVRADWIGVDEHWGRVIEFAGRCSSPRSNLSSWVPFLFLEFDAESAALPVSVPSVFVALDSPIQDVPERPHVWAALEAATTLLGCPLPQDLRTRLIGAFDVLPSNGRVLHLGVMLGRRAPGLRLSVLLPGGSVRPYLLALGGVEAARAADTVLRAMPRWLGTAQIDFDLAPDPLPRVGFGVRPSGGSSTSWRALLGELEALGCCDEVRARDMLAWPRKPETVDIRGQSFHFRREISHVKLVCTPSSSLEAKAYLGVARLD